MDKQETQVPLSHLEAMVERKVKEVLANMLKLNDQTDSNTVSVAEAATILGYPSSQAIYKDIASGLLRVGHEVEDRRRPGAERPRYYIDIEATRQRLQSDPSKRRAI